MTRAPRIPAPALLFGAALALLGTVASAGGLQEAGFPHAAHEGLFPLCTGCHEGVPLGDEADFYPSPASCSGCHDGVREPVVGWQGPTRGADNVRFVHVEHDAEVSAANEPPRDCASCHVPAGAGRMAVADTVQTASCWGCHEGTEHHVDAECTVCHVPLAETGFAVARIAALPVPADHASGFLEAHGGLARRDAARCATCHTRERCVSCHVDASPRVIASFPSAPPEMQLPATVAHYSVPASHLAPDWLSSHAGGASRARCATCHTREDCTSCHVEPAPAVIAALPARADVEAPGARLVARAPASHESFFFLEARHQTLAAASPQSCATCHQESFCVECHDGPPGGGYHPASFVARHAAEAFGRDAECASCHSTEAFCRECHSEVGLQASGRLGPGYHDGGPVWLLRHGQAARQSLESCASCHEQTDCMQCHSVLGAFKVSPHGSGFDAERAWARSPRTCLACHVGRPF